MRGEQQSKNDAWDQLKRNVEAAGRDTIGKLTVQKRNDWLDDECQDPVSDKNSAGLNNLARFTLAGKVEYRSK